MLNKKTLMVFTLVFSLVMSTTPLFVSAAPPEKINVIIGFHAEPDVALIKAHNGEVRDTIHQIHALVATIPETAMIALQNNPKVRYVEEDKHVQLIQAQTVPWGVDRIDAEKVWSDYTGTGVTIAIVDTGIDYTHPDLAANCLPGESFVDYTEDWMDDDGHGTHCGGIAAAINNGIGVVGVAPGANLLPVKVLDYNGGAAFSWVANGIIWAADNGADVISLSLGYRSSVQSWQAACDYAYYTKGKVVVAAAGNSGNKGGNNDCVEYPARYASTIAVGATTQSDNRASFSSTGPDVELAAPGYQIYSTYWDDTYDYVSGTSQACPHVSGVAALVIGSGITNNVEVRNRMTSTAEDLGASGRDWRYGYGLIDAEASVVPPDKHDVAITAINVPSSVVKGDTATIDITVENQGTYAETTTVTLTDMYDGGVIGSESVSLNAGASTIVTFYWDTTNETLGDHILKAEASVVPGETETEDNTMSTTVNVYEQGEYGMYVWDISWKDTGPKMRITVNIKADSDNDKIAEQSDDPVNGATVTLKLTHLDSGDSWAAPGTTDSGGKVTFVLSNAPSGNYEALVTDLTHSTYTWDPSMDADNPDYYTR